MGRGSSKAGGGGGVAKASGTPFDQALALATRGQIPVTQADYDDIVAVNYGINPVNLPSQDRAELVRIASQRGATQNNSQVANVDSGKVGQLNLGEMTLSNLISFSKIANKINTRAAQTATEDALKLISFYKSGT